MSDNNKALQAIFRSADLEVRLLPDSNTHRLRMEIDSESSNRVYVVSQRQFKDGGTQFECSCPGWIHHRKCKHLTAMTPALEQAAAFLDKGSTLRNLSAGAPKKIAAPSKKIDPFPVKKSASKAKSPAAQKKNGLEALKGQLIQSIEGDKNGFRIVTGDGSVLEISSRYEGGINIELEQEEVVTEKKKVKKNIA